MAMVVGMLVAMVNGATTTLARLSLLHRLLERLRKWWQTLRQLSVLTLWFLPMAVAFGKQARQSQPLLQLQQAVKGLGTLLRLSAFRLRLAQMQTSLSAALLRLSQQVARLRRQVRYLTAGRLSQPLLRLQQAAVKFALALQRSVFKAQSQLLAKLNGKPNRVPQPAGQTNPAQARTTQNSPAPAHHGNGQREE